jgi:hypothetical protein
MAMAGGSWVLFGDVSDSELRGDQLRATAPNGEARVRGGVFDAAFPNGPFGGPLALSGSSVTHNEPHRAQRARPVLRLWWRESVNQGYTPLRVLVTRTTSPRR